MYAAHKELIDYLDNESQSTQLERAAKQVDFDLIRQQSDDDDDVNSLVTEEEYLSEDAEANVPFVGPRTVAYVDDQIMRNPTNDLPPTYEEATRDNRDSISDPILTSTVANPCPFHSGPCAFQPKTEDLVDN